MPRKPREIVDGGIYHVYARGNNFMPIFQNDFDRIKYLKILGKVTKSLSWNSLAYCLMSNHVHLLIETPLGNLSAGMQRVQGPYTQWFNYRHKRCGHLFQGRYGAKRIVSDSQLTTTVDYIAFNPVEAGLRADYRDWPWSSFYELAPKPDWLCQERLEELVDGPPGERRS